MGDMSVLPVRLLGVLSWSIGCFHKSPFEIIVGLLGSVAITDFASTAFHCRDSACITSQLLCTGKACNETNFRANNNGTRGVVATVQELGAGLSQTLRARILDTINDRFILVTGYNDDDLDLFPLLQSSRPRAIYWNTLSQEIPTKVNQWFLQLDKTISIAHLWNRCEYLFGDFPSTNNRPLPSGTHWNLQEFVEKWVMELNSVVGERADLVLSYLNS
jgi:hypothetical protein